MYENVLHFFASLFEICSFMNHDIFNTEWMTPAQLTSRCKVPFSSPCNDTLRFSSSHSLL